MSASATHAARTRTGSGSVSRRTNATPAPVGGVGGNQVGGGATVAGSVAKHHVHLLGLIQPHRDPIGEQVADRHDLLARVLERGDHAVADRPALGRQRRQRRLDPLTGDLVGVVGSQERDLIDQHHHERMLDGGGVVTLAPGQHRGACPHVGDSVSSIATMAPGSAAYRPYLSKMARP